MKYTALLHKKKLLRRTIVLAVAIFFFIPAASFAMTAKEVVDLVNQSRKEEGIPPVRWDEDLARAAEQKAHDMFLKGYFSHWGPDAKKPWDWMKENGYFFEVAGENLAIHYQSAQEQHRAWMESPLHRRNILNPLFTDIGVGVVSGKWKGKETTIVVQMFGRRKSSSLAGSVYQQAPPLQPGKEVAAVEPPRVLASSETLSSHALSSPSLSPSFLLGSVFFLYLTLVLLAVSEMLLEAFVHLHRFVSLHKDSPDLLES